MGVNLKSCGHAVKPTLSHISFGRINRKCNAMRAQLPLNGLKLALQGDVDSMARARTEN